VTEPIVPSDAYKMVWDESGVAAHYLGDRLDAEFPRHYGGFLFFDKGRMLGCVSIYDYRNNKGRPSAFIVGVAESPRIWSRKNIRDMTKMFFEKPPYGMGLCRLNSFVTDDNLHSQKITERFGFKREGMLREAGPDGEDTYVFGLLPSDLTWHVRPDDTSGQSLDNPKNGPLAEQEDATNGQEVSAA